MPVNLDALLRYHTIDLCLQNHYKKWTWEDLADACAEYANEVAPRDTRSIPSKRTIQQDIKVMRSADLGYNAPIENKGGFYFYTDKSYSIKNATISKTDLENIGLLTKIAAQYKGLPFNNYLQNFLNKLESSIYLKTAKSFGHIIEFENLPNAAGTEFLASLIEYISKKQVIELTYQKFNSNKSKQYTFHPYFLKEYRNRWYVIGWYSKENYIKTFALDRIINLENSTKEMFYKENLFNEESWLKDTIGITFSGEAPVDVILKVDPDFAPYLISQPLHQSQQIIHHNKNHLQLKLNVIINQELQTLITSYAEFIEVISPEKLKTAIQTKLEKALQKYKRK